MYHFTPIHRTCMHVFQMVLYFQNYLYSRDVFVFIIGTKLLSITNHQHYMIHTCKLFPLLYSFLPPLEFFGIDLLKSRQTICYVHSIQICGMPAHYIVCALLQAEAGFKFLLKSRSCQAAIFPLKIKGVLHDFSTVHCQDFSLISDSYSRLNAQRFKFLAAKFILLLWILTHYY